MSSEGLVATCAFMISTDLGGPGSFVSRVIESRLRTESILEKLSSKRFPGARPSFKARAMMNQCGVFHAGRERRFVLRHQAPSTQTDLLCWLGKRASSTGADDRCLGWRRTPVSEADGAQEESHRGAPAPGSGGCCGGHDSGRHRR